MNANDLLIYDTLRTSELVIFNHLNGVKSTISYALHTSSSNDVKVASNEFA